MANPREIFSVLENPSTKEGQGWSEASPGDAESARNKGAVIPAVDLAGDLQLNPHRDEGDAGALAGIAVLPAKDNSGQNAFIPLNADGEIPVSMDGSGVKVSASAEATAGGLDTEFDVAVLTLVASTKYQAPHALGGSFSPESFYILYQDDNGALTELARFLSGSGQFQSGTNGAQLANFTTGATGVQRLVLRATQERGSLADHHGVVSVKQG